MLVVALAGNAVGQESVDASTVARDGGDVPVVNPGLLPQSQPRRAPASWTADRRQFQVGDVITVLIDEQTLASATTGNFASDRRSRDLFASADQSVTGAIPRIAGTIGSTNDAESRQRGEAIRRNRFVGEMTVRVTAIENGLVHVSGTRSTVVDKHEQSLSLTGWIRPEDVSSSNLVESWRIGDAEIEYQQRGDLGKPKQGLLTRVIGWIWP